MPIRDDILRTAWWRFTRLWRPMALWTLAVFLFFGAFLGPILSSAVRRAIFRGDRVMVGNEDLVAWMLQPEGVIYTAVAGALLVMGGVLRYAGLFAIIRNDITDTATSLQRTLANMLRDLPALFKLCLVGIVAAVCLTLPLLAGAGISYLLWLTEFDINYYLYATPPDWTYALIAFGVWTLFWLIAAGYLVLRTLPALPAYLDGHRPVKDALRRSWHRTRGDAWRILGLLAICVIGWICIRTLAWSTFYLISGVTIDYLAAAFSSVTPILVLTGSWLALSLGMDAALSFVGFSFVATVLTKFYFEDTDLHSTLPAEGPARDRLPQRMLTSVLRWIHPARLIPALGAMLLTGFVASAFLLELGEEPPHFEIAAHRAGAHLAPENTLAALERTIDAGADYAEIDVQMTPDSVLVVAHDADLMRVAGDSRRIAETPFTEMSNLVQGQDPSIPQEERRIATLGDFLKRSAGRIELMIEPKYYGPSPGLVEGIVEEVRAYEMEDQVLLVALEMDALHQIMRMAPELPVGYLASVTLGDITRLPVGWLGVSYPLATSGLISAAHARDLSVHVWTLNRASTMLQAIGRGADGIITDDPILAAQLRDQMAELSTAERLLLHLRPTSLAPFDIQPANF